MCDVRVGMYVFADCRLVQAFHSLNTELNQCSALESLHAILDLLYSSACISIVHMIRLKLHTNQVSDDQRL